MGSFSEDEECPFFDAISDDTTDTTEANSSPKDVFLNEFGYQVWIRSPPSVHERRNNFMKWMGLSKEQVAVENSVDVDVREGEVDRMKDSSGSVTRSSSFKEEFCSNQPSVSSQSRMDSSDEFNLVENMQCRDGKSESGARWNLDPLGLYRERNDGGRGAGSDHRVVAEECKDSEYFLCVSANFQHEKICKESEDRDDFKQRSKRNNRGWFKRFGSISCMIDRLGESDSSRLDGSCVFLGSNRIRKVKVQRFRKHTKELSALYMGQDIQAHRGSILTMKFSPDGRFLASAGEDGIVRLWKVVEDEGCNEVDIPEVDPSCIYFTVNNLSELTPLSLEKEKLCKVKGLNKTSDSACIVFPPKIFRLLDKPLHEFHGHEGEILDLSWSNNNCLLSSSVDKTVRLWQVGHDFCLKVFPHSNYVTCIQFNPVNDNYFISGSIDGKVRIWEVPDCHVVDWTDIREIVTAVCYRPNGQGGIIGSMTGNCRFYTLSENHLQLDSQLCLLGKKKLHCRGITGFQFLPQDSNKVMVTCADSKVRILDGLNVVSKYEGLSAAGQMSASVTPDGKHILSTCKDSNVYLWNVIDSKSSSTKAKKIKSCERFFSNASGAVPWCGFGSAPQLDIFGKGSPQAMCLNPAASFSLSRDISSESLPKGSATWPEEKLPTSSPKAKISTMHKSAYKFLKSSCKCTSSCHAWDLVILTAGWDGRIKSFHNFGLPVLA
ncbi:hypothetical protein PIB30_045554 [Stylosanthes scabra]|uniref:Uncharacterized protein n=1 Tax=Stylosanthes scabra TaxID=79078 RepID=A0ABU6VHL5_9FABA|nr:hypothetical protein [Stylosanthes scabra]